MNSERGPNDAAAASAESKEREESFLRRWSRRKRETTASEATPVVEASDAASDAPISTTAEKILTDADMPPIESLDERSDFSVFLSSGVSEGLRRQALRKLFMLPSINQRCPLDSEYYDCRNLEPLGDIVTHDMREEMRRAAEKLKDAAKSALSEDDAATPADATDDIVAATNSDAPADDSESQQPQSTSSSGVNEHR